MNTYKQFYLIILKYKLFLSNRNSTWKSEFEIKFSENMFVKQAHNHISDQNQYVHIISL